MKRLNYCCGKEVRQLFFFFFDGLTLSMQLFFNPQTLYCSGKQVCIIARDTKYKKFEADFLTVPVNYCLKCFKEVEDSSIEINPDATNDVQAYVACFKFFFLAHVV